MAEANGIVFDKPINSLENLREYLVLLRDFQVKKWQETVAEYNSKKGTEGFDDEFMLMKIESIKKQGQKTKSGIDFIDNKNTIGDLPEDVVKLMLKLIF